MDFFQGQWTEKKPFSFLHDLYPRLISTDFFPRQLEGKKREEKFSDDQAENEPYLASLKGIPLLFSLFILGRCVKMATH